MPELHGEIIASIVQECAAQAEMPPKVGGWPDRYVGMFALGLARALSDASPEQQETFAYAVDIKSKQQPFRPNEVIQNALRLYQMDHMRDPCYPHRNQDEWDEELHTLFNNREQLDRMAELMQMWNVGSDVETRAAGPKLVAHALLPERAQDKNAPLKILSVGSARDHGLAMIAGDVPFPEVTMAFVGRYPKHTRIFLGKRFNELLAKHVELGHSTGVDFWPLRDQEWSKFLEACRYYPSELHDAQKRKRYQELEDIRDKHPEIDHIDADFAGKTPLTDKYDLVLFSTSLYQNNHLKRRQMFDNALDVLEPGGLIVVQDFCEPKSPNPSDKHPLGRLRFLGPVSRQYKYITSFYDPDQSDKGLQTFIIWNNGRCERFRPSELLVDTLLLGKTR